MVEPTTNRFAQKNEILHDNVDYSSFQKLLGRDVGVLRLAGLHSLNCIFTGKDKTPTNFEAWAFGMGVTNLFLLVLCEFNTAMKVWRTDSNQAIGAASGGISGCLCLVKASRLWLWRYEYRKLLRRFAIMWDESQLRFRIRNENFKTAEGTYYMTKYYIYMVVVLCISYAVRPYLLLLYHERFNKLSNISYDYNERVFPTTYPVITIDMMSKYMISLLWEIYVMMCGAFYWLSLDIMFAQLTTHTAIQFRVLRHDLEYVTDTDDNGDTLGNDKMYIHRLSTIAKRHRDLYRYCETIESIYNPIIFLTMMLAAVNMCFCAFHLQEEMSNGNFPEAVKSLSHAVSVSLQASIYCCYADKLTEQSSLVAESAYECQWIERSKEFKILMQMIMMRSQKVFNCTAYGFFFVNISQMTVITKTAASYFTLLKTMA